jgi:hypothetical protein
MGARVDSQGVQGNQGVFMNWEVYYNNNGKHYASDDFKQWWELKYKNKIIASFPDGDDADWLCSALNSFDAILRSKQ